MDFRAMELHRRQKVISIFSLYIIAFLLVFIVIDLFLERYLISVILFVLLCTSSANLLYMKRSGNTDWASRFVLFPFMMYSITIFYEGGMGNSGAIWSFFVPIFAFYLKGATRGIRYVISYLLLVLLVFVLSVNGFIEQHYSVLFFLNYFGALLAASSFLLVFENLRQQYAELARANSEKLLKANRELQLISTRDFLTGIHNRRQIQNIIEREIQRFGRYNSPLSVILIDLDHFKSINDNYGHDFGDSVLKEFSRQTEGMLRLTDSLGRYGGEEFLIVLPDTKLSRAMEVAERVRSCIEHTTMMKEEKKQVKFTVSSGVGEYHEGETSDAFIKRIDDALYFAKDNGRNCCYAAH